MKAPRTLFFNLFVSAFILMLAGASHATVWTINNVINGSQEVPPVTTSGSGTIVGTYDDVTNLLSATITFSGLTGTTSAGHYHGPAAAGSTAGVRIGFTNIPLGVTSGSFSPSHTLTASQETELLSGLWYVNIHTSFRPGGEIRGQIYPALPQYNLSLTHLIEGLYDAGLNLMVGDTVTVNIRNSASPFALIESKKLKLSNTGTGAFIYNLLSNSTPYYIQVTHRNGLETWSGSTVQFTSNSASYDFTSSAAQTYGNNSVLKGTKYCSYSGDTNQDGAIDASDLSQIDNDATGFVSGYVPTDLDGNDFVDGSDAAIAGNNAFNFVGVIRP